MNVDVHVWLLSCDCIISNILTDSLSVCVSVSVYVCLCVSGAASLLVLW